MKKTKIGDIYAFKTERGYRILHWAYTIEKYGRYTRVMPGFYDSIPDNIMHLVDEECAYIIDFDSSRMCRKGIFEWVGNKAVSEKYPFPKHDIFCYCRSNDNPNLICFQVCNSTFHQEYENYWADCSGNGLPEKYKDIKLLNTVFSPLSALCLIASDFDMHNWDNYDTNFKREYYGKLYGHLF